MAGNILSEHLIKVTRGLAAVAVLFWLSACSAADMPSARAHIADMVAEEDDDDDSFGANRVAVSEKDDDDDDDSFEVADNVSDRKLSTMRGGFVTVGGMNINFGFSSITTINGVVQNSLNLSSNSLNGSIPQNLQQIVLSSSGTQYVTTGAVGNAIVNIVQNSVNNAVIQNTNVLNLTVGNLSSFRNQMIMLNGQLTAVLAAHH